MRWTIYCHTHVESGRRYVGLTRLTMLKRWNSHVYTANRVKDGRPAVAGHFPNAIRKYGKDAFSHEVLEVCPTLELANLAEEKWIAHFDTRNPEKGFNLAKGGVHAPHPVKNPWDRPEYRSRMNEVDRSHLQSPSVRANNRAALNTPESRDKRAALSKRLYEERPWLRERLAEKNTGKTLSPETIARLSIANVRIPTDETKSRIAESVREARRLQRGARTHKLCKKHGPVPLADCYKARRPGYVHYLCKACVAEKNARRKMSAAQA